MTPPTTVLQSNDAPSFVRYRPTRVQEPSWPALTRLVANLTAKRMQASLLAGYAPQPWAALERLPTVLDAYRERVAKLREFGEADGITLRRESEAAFFDFIKSNAYTGKASLVLLDNGNLRAVWKDDDGSHVGVQFHGEEIASCVIFKRRTRGAEVSRVAGKDTLDGVRKQIRVFGLDGLVSG